MSVPEIFICIMLIRSLCTDIVIYRGLVPVIVFTDIGIWISEIAYWPTFVFFIYCLYRKFMYLEIVSYPSYIICLHCLSRILPQCLF